MDGEYYEQRRGGSHLGRDGAEGCHTANRTRSPYSFRIRPFRILNCLYCARNVVCVIRCGPLASASTQYYKYTAGTGGTGGTASPLPLNPPLLDVTETRIWKYPMRGHACSYISRPVCVCCACCAQGVNSRPYTRLQSCTCEASDQIF